MRPRNFSGEGTVSEAGMWSTSSVVMRGSCRYSLMRRVYSSSSFCGCAAGAGAGFAFLLCADSGIEHTATHRMAHTRRECISDTNTASPAVVSTIGQWTDELLAQGGDRLRARSRDAAADGRAA